MSITFTIKYVLSYNFLKKSEGLNLLTKTKSWDISLVYKTICLNTYHYNIVDIIKINNKLHTGGGQTPTPENNRIIQATIVDDLICILLTYKKSHIYICIPEKKGPCSLFRTHRRQSGGNWDKILCSGKWMVHHCWTSHPGWMEQ